MTDGDDRVRGWLGRERPHETLACVEKYKIKTFRILIIMITNTAFSSHSVADVVSSQETKRIFERGSEGESVAYPPVLIIKRLGRAGHMSTRCSRRGRCWRLHWDPQRYWLLKSCGMLFRSFFLRTAGNAAMSCKTILCNCKEPVEVSVEPPEYAGEKNTVGA